MKMNKTIIHHTIQNYRLKSFRIQPNLRIKNQSEAIEFVNERGFIFFWSISGISFPSLWTAVAGDRPVADEHDDPGHITWRWKDDLLGTRKWYYAKVLRKKATIISNEALPYFYALSNNYGSPEEDHLILYEQGKLSIEEKQLYEALLQEGALDTIALKRAAHLSSTQSDSRFNRALTDLQTDFKITPVGIAEVGSWRYAFIYDITTRYIPEIIEKTRYISDQTAREKLLRLYFLAVGGASLSEAVKLFQWSPKETSQALHKLIEHNFLVSAGNSETQKGEWFLLKSLIN
jgi:hypothetical protein